MNEKQAIELATEHGITVSTDIDRKTYVCFKVGDYEISRSKDARKWFVNHNGMTFTQPGTGRTLAFKRGEAIEFCVTRTLEWRTLNKVAQ